MQGTKASLPFSETMTSLPCPLCHSELPVEEETILQMKFKYHLEKEHNSVKGYEILFNLLKLDGNRNQVVLKFLSDLVKALEEEELEKAKNEVNVSLSESDEIKVEVVSEEDFYNCRNKSNSLKLSIGARTDHHGVENCIMPIKTSEDAEIERNPKVNCSQCEATFKTTINLIRHVHENHRENDKIHCPIVNCEMVCKTRSGLLDHYVLQHDQRDAQFTCKECGKAFMKKSRFTQHMQYSHTTEIQVCQHCSKVFQNNTKLQIHIGHAHNRELRATCEHCGKVFINKHVLAVHLASEHKIGEEGIFKCSKCDRTFVLKKLLKKHVTTFHKNKNRFQCEQCDYKCSNLSILRRHGMVHSDIKDIYCELCGDVYKSQQTLKAHIRQVHEKERNFPCNECGKSFFTKIKMEQHAKIHSGQKDHICQFCEKRFIQKTNRDTHEKKVHSAIMQQRL